MSDERKGRHVCEIGRAEDPTLHQARCSCGWWGPPRRFEADCFPDRHAHRTAVPGWWFPHEGYKPSERDHAS